jgi:hypothetical protein
MLLAIECRRFAVELSPTCCAACNQGTHYNEDVRCVIGGHHGTGGLFDKAGMIRQ